MDETPYICPKCGSDGPFYRYEYARLPVCAACSKKTSREWRLANRERKAKLNRRAHLRREYGLSELAYAQLLEAQGDSCAICRGASDDGLLHIDHDHRTGEVRGLLCARCNHGLGHFADDVDSLAGAVRYLEDPPARRFRAAVAVQSVA